MKIFYFKSVSLPTPVDGRTLKDDESVYGETYSLHFKSFLTAEETSLKLY